MKKMSKLLPAALLAVGVIVLGLCIQSGLKSFANRGRVVSVRGLAEREVKADKAIWPIRYKLVGNDLPTLYAQLSNYEDIILRFLAGNGIEDSEIYRTTPAVTDLDAERYSSNDRPFRYMITSGLTVATNKVDQVLSLINKQTDLLKKGVPLSTDEYGYEASFEYTELNSIKPDMIAEATANAREAAKKFAEDSHSKVGGIQQAEQGQFSIEDRDSYTPYIKKVRVVTYVDYALE